MGNTVYAKELYSLNYNRILAVQFIYFEQVLFIRVFNPIYHTTQIVNTPDSLPIFVLALKKVAILNHTTKVFVLLMS